MGKKDNEKETYVTCLLIALIAPTTICLVYEEGGHGLEIFAEPYYNVERPEGAADWTIKSGIEWLLP